VLHDVLGCGLAPVLGGVATGVLGAEAAVRLARSFIYELPALEAGLVAATTAGLVVVVAAVVIPHAWRAMRVNPAIVRKA
jgi:hypothetical protein